MAKTRAQRKAEQKRRENAAKAGPGEGQAAEYAASEESHAQHDTQMGVSGEVREAEATIQTGQNPPDSPATAPPAPAADPFEATSPEAPEPVELQAPAPSRADVGAPPAAEPADPSRDERRARKEREKEERRKQRARQMQKGQSPDAPVAAEKRRRGGVFGFFGQCWAELKRVQWPDRDTLIQASAVTLVFVLVMASYLGALDAIFNFVVKNLIL